MAETVYLKPKDPAAIVRDPVTRQPLKPDGEDKPLDIYWRRRLAAGEVVRATRPKAPKTPKSQES